MKKTRMIAGIAAAIVFGTLAGGCSSDDEIARPGNGAGGLPPTPDALMAAYAEAYADMDLAAYGELLHEDFVFAYDRRGRDAAGLPADDLTREDELAVTARMFSRRPYVKSDGRVVAPILSIEFLTFAREGDWETVPDAEGPDRLRATYRVHVRFHRGSAGDLTVRGRSIYEAVGDATGGYRLIGWIDRTGGD